MNTIEPVDVAVSAEPARTKPDIIGLDDMNMTRFMILAPSMWLANRWILYPTNLVKTRLQTQHGVGLYTGTLDCYRKVIKYEGIRGLWRGFFSNSFGVIGSQA